MPVLDNAGRGVGVKLACALLRLAVVDFVAAAVWHTVVRIQVQVDRDLPRPTTHSARHAVRQSLVQTTFEDSQRFGQPVVQGGQYGVIGGPTRQIAARGRDGNRTSRGTEHNPQHHSRGAEPSVIFDQFCLK